MQVPVDVGFGRIPKEYLCPITQDLMDDPVVAEDGHTYERIAITRWFSTGKTRSPVTNEELPHQAVVANHTLRKLIGHHRQHYGDLLMTLCKSLSEENDNRQDPAKIKSEVMNLLEKGADPNVRDSVGNTPLMIVVTHGRDELVNDFLSFGARVTSVNDNGETVLSLARGKDGMAFLVRKLAKLEKDEREQIKHDTEQRRKQRKEYREQQERQRRTNMRPSDREAAAHNMRAQSAGVSPGIGFFPSLFGLLHQGFNDPSTFRPNANPETREEAQQTMLARVLLVIGTAVLVSLLIL